MAAVTLPAAIPSITVGGRVFTDLENLITLAGYTTNNANPRSTPAPITSSRQTTGYQVPVGKSFRVLAVEVFPTGNVVSNGERVFRLSYADNDVGSVGASTAFTNDTSLVGAVNSLSIGSNANTMASVTGFAQSCNAYIPAGKYPAVTSEHNAPMLYRIYGYEVPA